MRNRDQEGLHAGEFEPEAHAESTMASQSGGRQFSLISKVQLLSVIPGLNSS